MTYKPEFFLSTSTGTRLILTQPGLVPDVSGDLSLYTPEVGKLRPLMDPVMIPAKEGQDNEGDTRYTYHSWRFSFLDPATNQRLTVSRSAEYSINVDGIKLQNLVLGPETLIDDSRYIATCQFVLFHGRVDELDQTITVVSGINERGVTATIGNRSVAVLDRQRSALGSVNYLFPRIGALYLPSSQAIADESDREPTLDNYTVTPLPVDQAALSRLPNPPLTWDLIKY